MIEVKYIYFEPSVGIVKNNCLVLKKCVEFGYCSKCVGSDIFRGEELAKQEVVGLGGLQVGLLG